MKATAAQLDKLWAEGDRLIDSGEVGEGVRLWRLCVKHGHASAMTSLGNLHQNGIGVRRSTALALKLFKRAATTGDGVAAANIGAIYRRQGRVNLARKWFRRAVNFGITEMLLDIAKLDVITGRANSTVRSSLRKMLRDRDLISSVREEAESLLQNLPRRSRSGYAGKS